MRTSATHTSPLSLHDALPISSQTPSPAANARSWTFSTSSSALLWATSSRISPTNPATPQSAPSFACSKKKDTRSEEHTSELQSLRHLVCRLLLEKKNKKNN